MIRIVAFTTAREAVSCDCWRFLLSSQQAHTCVAHDALGRDITADLYVRIIVHGQARRMDGPLTTEAMRMLVRLIVAEPSGRLALSLGSLAAFFGDGTKLGAKHTHTSRLSD